MAKKNPLVMGNPKLYQKSLRVKQFGSKVLSKLEKDLLDTMKSYGGVGIAAPQIGVFKQVMIIGFQGNPRYPDVKPIPLTTLVNLEWKPLSEDTVFGWEGCLSVPGIRGVVRRYRQISYHAYDIEGNELQGEVQDLEARIIQHEHDHLIGVLFPQRVLDVRHLAVESAALAYVKANKTPEDWLELMS